MNSLTPSGISLPPGDSSKELPRSSSRRHISSDGRPLLSVVDVEDMRSCS